MSTNMLRALLAEINPMGKLIEYTDNDDLFSNFLLDSMTVIQLIAALEEKFNLVFDFNDVTRSNFENLNNIEQMLVNKYQVKS